MWCFHRKLRHTHYTLLLIFLSFSKLARRTRRRAVELQPRKHHASLQRIRAKNDQVSLEDTFGVT